MRRRLLSSLGFAVAISSTGCPQRGTLPEPQVVQQRVALTAFSGAQACADLEKYIEDVAVLEMRTQLETMKNSYYGRGGGDVVMAGEAAPTADGAAAPSSSAAGTASAAAPTDYTTTNTQVAGVDEADFVKNDANRIFVLSGNTLYATLSWPASQLALSGQLQVEGYPREMVLTENNEVVVFSQLNSAPMAPVPAGADMPVCAALECHYSQPNAVKVTVVDVTSLSNMTVKHEYYLPGQYANARRAGTSVRVVLSGQPSLPSSVQYYPSGNHTDEASFRQAMDALILSNESAIRNASIDEWLPLVQVKKADGSLESLGRNCEDFYRVNAPTQLGLLTVATLNLANPGSLRQSTVVAQVGEVYASSANLYVTNHHWWWQVQAGQTDATYVHKFDLSSPEVATYVASGTVDGHLVNQFAMDEGASGHLRVATTTRTFDASGGGWWSQDTTNQIQVLEQQGDVLTVVGQTEALAPGERIYSARFVGDEAYVVTFRETDPLYTFNLSNPTQPLKVGELKIPGFSTYIHPIGPNHLLTIGTYVPEAPASWTARAVQLQVFDVTDRANPKQAHVQLVGTAYGSSEAQYEHKAFNYFAAKKTLAIPFFDWSPSAQSPNDYWTSFVSELRVYGVDGATGFTYKGALSMKDLYPQNPASWGWYYYYQPMVRRSVMADDFVYAISDAGIRVAHINALSTPVADVEFPFPAAN